MQLIQKQINKQNASYARWFTTKSHLSDNHLLSTGINNYLNIKPVTNNKFTINSTKYVSGSIPTLIDTSIAAAAMSNLDENVQRMAVINTNVYYNKNERAVSNAMQNAKNDKYKCFVECDAKPLHTGKTTQIWNSVCRMQAFYNNKDEPDYIDICNATSTVLNMYVKDNKASILQDKHNVLKKDNFMQQEIIDTTISDSKLDGFEINNIIGIELFDITPNIVDTKIIFSNKHLAGTNVIHGGVEHSIFETTMKYLAQMNGFDDDDLTQININFISSHIILNDTLICRASISHEDNYFLTLHAQLINVDNNDKILANARALFVRKDRNETTKINSSFFDEKRFKNFGTKFNVKEMSKEEIREKFNKYSKNWSDVVEKLKYEPVFKWIESNCSYLMQNGNNIDSMFKVLDLGIGIGLIGECLKKNEFNNATFYGCDLSLGMLEQSMKKNIYKHLFVQDLDNDIISLAPHQFDLITCFGVTEMLKDINHLLQEIGKLIKKNDMNKQVWITFQLKTNDEIIDAYQGLNNYTIDYIKDAFKHNGFKIIDYEITDNAYYLPSPQNTDETETTEMMPIPFIMVKAYHP